MRCSPLRWLWGLLPLAVVWGISLLSLRPVIETELANRIGNELSKKGLDWASAQVSGRDVELIGRGSDDNELAEAARIAAQVRGVRVVDNKTSLIDKADTYIWNASQRDGRIKLSGFVPSEEVRKTMLGMVQSKFPGRDVQDLTKLARGAPSKDVWLSGMSFGLNQLTQLKRGSVELEGTNLVVEGDADDAKAYRSVKSALSEQLPKSIVLKSEKVRPPVAQPYIWAATTTDKQLVLTGFVPADTNRRAIVAEARKLFPKRDVVDRMEFGSGEPRGFDTAALAGLKSLSLLEDGHVDIKDAAVTFNGTAETQAIADTAKKSLRDASASMRHSEQVKVKEPPLPNVSPFTTSANVQSGTVTLAGYVPSDAARAQVLEAAKARLPGRRIIDNLQLAAGAPQGWLPCVQSGLLGLGKVGNGSAAISNRSMVLTGTADSENLEPAVAADVKAAAGANCDTDVRLAVSAEARQKAEMEARMKAEAEAKAKADADAKVRAEAEAKLRAEADAKAKAKAEADAKLRAEADAKARIEADTRAKAEADARAKAAADASRQAAAVSQATQCKDTLSKAASAGVINFERASANLTANSFPTLDRLASIVKACPVDSIEVEGHTDAEGIPERNQPLSERRAQAVVDYLVRAGVAGSQLKAIGYGAERPVAPNDTPDGRARNRRIGFDVKPKQ